MTVSIICMLQVTLTIIYFKSFSNADLKCIFCPFEPHVLKHLTPNDTLNPRGCYSSSFDRLAKQTYKLASTCSWDIIQEPFESFFDASEEMGKPTPKVWRLVPPGLVSALLFDNKNKPANTCERLEIPYSFTPEGAKVKIIRCYCAPETCNKDYPLCKWLRAADPKLTDPLGCVEDDTFPSKKEPKLYKGLLYKRLDGEPVPGSKPVEKRLDSRSARVLSCADEINYIYNGIKEIQQLLNDEL